MGGSGCHHDWVAGILVLCGVVASVLGRRENGESELNTWKSAAILNRFRAWCSGKENPTTGANACIMGAEEGEKDGTAKWRE